MKVQYVLLLVLISFLILFQVKQYDKSVYLSETQNMFALRCRSNQELKEKLYCFALADDDIDKFNFLQTLCRQLANTVCKADAVWSKETFSLTNHFADGSVCPWQQCISLMVLFAFRHTSYHH